MGRRSYSREFKLEAVRLVRERGVSIAKASRDLDQHPNMLRKWVKDFAADPAQAFPGQGQMKPEIERLRREVAKLKAERDILKKAAAYFAKDQTDVRVRCEAPEAPRRGLLSQPDWSNRMGWLVCGPRQLRNEGGFCRPAIRRTRRLA
jgi:transposase